MRRFSLAMVVFLTGCSSPTPVKVEPAKPDPTKQAWYQQAVQELNLLNDEAQAAFRVRRSDQAAGIITKAQGLIQRVLSVPSPTLPAMEAVSDLDDLYGRMLAANQHYGAARFLFQKNLARWKNWRPQTGDTARRLKQAQAGAAVCDRHLPE